MLAFALTIFTGAFLLFQVQPLIGKFILPWFGGGPGIWTTCMLFFQVLLLGGYAYAHLLTRWFQPRRQVIIHLALVAAAVALLPISPSESWKPRGGEDPVLQILLLLTGTLGAPYFLLSSTGPLLQHWFSLARPGVSPYRLYALSNVGSLLALVSYPFYFETHFTRRTQALMWGWGLAVYAVACAVCALKLWRLSRQPAPMANPEEAPASGAPGSEPSTAEAAPTLLRYLFWLLLPACASVLLLATTNKLCQDVAVFPFLWVVPLAVYLLTFIIAFDSPRWYARPVFGPALVLALAASCWALAEGSDWPLWKQVTIYGGSLFVCCLVCHGELYRLRPEPQRLTSFYLMIALGGALGGMFVALAAPVLFTNYYELHWGLWLCGFLFLAICLVENSTWLGAAAGGSESAEGDDTPAWRWLAAVLPVLGFAAIDFAIRHATGRISHVPKWMYLGARIALWLVFAALVASWIRQKRFRCFPLARVIVCGWLTLGSLGLGWTLWYQAHDVGRETVYRARNFYGVLSVCEYNKTNAQEHYYLLLHGRITHGLQFTDPDQAMLPNSYYGENSGIFKAMGALTPGPHRIGVVGLGTGTLALYGAADDQVRFYEINPQVRALATSRFTYLSNTSAKVEVVMGDARLSLEKERPQQFDLIALDAFSSDAIPVHLLTREAFEIYGRHLKTNGILAVHISNHFLDLEPVVANLAEHCGYALAMIDADESDEQWWLYSSTWVLLSRDPAVLKDPQIAAATVKIKTNPRLPLWTDDFASLFQILK